MHQPESLRRRRASMRRHLDHYKNAFRAIFIRSKGVYFPYTGLFFMERMLVLGGSFSCRKASICFS